MGKPPAAIFIARHGARLDAANKEWHLTSPTPYDPPLSYGGWLQSRALGARIVKELQSLEDQLDRSSQEAKDPRLPAQALKSHRQKRRIVIHTSPFLRCVQTAIAVSSGISQNYADVESLQPTDASSPYQSSNPASATSVGQESISATSQGSYRCLLRVDACLGEWLSPDYFENITPPPKSEKMVTAAKTELLRRDEAVIPAADHQNSPSVGHFPGGWGNFSSHRDEEDDKQSEAGLVMPVANGSGQRNRAGSYDSLRAVDTAWGRRMLKINTNLPSIPDSGYSPPVPSYAISPSNPIPDGYVTHARDACVQVDYQWDSMRDPQNWGNGGEYGDEWSTMHTRFRNGLERMISWYENHDASATASHRRRHSQMQFLDPDETEDDLTNTILVVITHGAGCNALIGALTGKPALVDVGTASLTLAIRKDHLQETFRNGDLADQPNSANKPSGPENYRLVEIASTDHLRPGTSPTTSIRSVRSTSTSSVSSPSISSYRNRFPSRASFSSGPVLIGPSWKANTALPSWTMPRPSSSGLWSSVSGSEKPVEDFLPNFGNPLSPSPSRPQSNGVGSPAASKPDDSGWSRQLPQRTLSQRGLWGSAPLNMERAANPTRRWTVTERPL